MSVGERGWVSGRSLAQSRGRGLIARWGQGQGSGRGWFARVHDRRLPSRRAGHVGNHCFGHSGGELRLGLWVGRRDSGV